MNEQTGLEIAVIGLSGRFPGSKTLDEFWKKLAEGVELTSVFSEEKSVKAYAILDNVEWFDASFFGFNPREAEAMDPQHRLFLECAWEALENAGYNSEIETRPIGVYAGVGVSTYLLYNLYPNQDIFKSIGALQSMVGVDKDYVPTRVSYKLNLTGPSVSVQTACSSSLVAVHSACQSLLSGECYMALAAGVSVKVPQNETTLSPGGIISPDGHCRAFDAKANGTIGGNGIGVVLLKRLEDAIADRDRIYAVIKGSAINNDGALKVGYTAPSEEGQAKVIRAAQVMAEVEPETISYLETHGTGTPLGDPIEIAAMTRAFRVSTDKKGYCAIGSVKTNIGHLDAASGIAGFIKTVLALDRQLLPPSLNFENPNPQIDFENSPFYVNTQPTEWKSNGTPRRAGISSFGFGGTNVHAILEEAPLLEASSDSREQQLLVLSAKTETALETATSNLTNYLKQNAQIKLADVAYTLQVGRRAFDCRRMVVANSVEEAINVLETIDPQRVFTRVANRKNRPVVFMFPGQGSQYANMGRKLYETEAVFRQECDRAGDILQSLGLNLKSYLFPAEGENAAQNIEQTAIAQPALFVIEYALAKLWMSWGVHPVAAIGHSIGEYVAACLAGVFSLEDALHLVLARGKLMQQCAPGAMLSVGLSAEEIKPFLNETVSLAAINAPSMTVVSGAIAALEQLESLLAEGGIKSRRLHTSHAFHSPMMEEIVEPFAEAVKKVKLNPPQLPFISNLTGTWITPEEAISHTYWAQHLRQPVLFSQGITELLQDEERVFLEVGPGRTLSTFVKQQSGETDVLTSLRHPQDRQSDRGFLLNSLGRLWLAGTKVDWTGFYEQEKRDRLPLPTYPFERERYWIDPPTETTNYPQNYFDKKPDIGDWFSIPSWKRSFLPLADLTDKNYCWLVFLDDCGIGSTVSDRLINDHSQTVIQVKIGKEFLKTSEYQYSINPGERQDYERLVTEVMADEQTVIIAHFWTVNPHQSFEISQEVGFNSLLYLAQAIGQKKLTESLQINVISSNLQEIIGDENICPDKATVLGLCNVIPQEYPTITCRHIDIVLPQETLEDRSLIDKIITEITANTPDLFVAYRGNYRWVQTFEPIHLEPHPNQSRLREKGVYLITGGLGGIGLSLANYLAEKYQAKLAMIGRSAFPSKEKWEDWLNQHEESDNIAIKIRRLQELEKVGSEVLVFSGDVSNEIQMRDIVEQIGDRFGAINGIIHAAGVLGESEIQRKTVAAAAATFAPKVQGTRVLCKLFKNSNLDFLILWSSISSYIGGFLQSDYSAANAFMDRITYPHCWTASINWDIWKDVGMAVNATSSGKLVSKHALEILDKGIAVQEGLEAFSRILENNINHIIVTTRDLKAIKKEEPIPGSASRDNAIQPRKQEHYRERLKLNSPYIAPRNPIEEKLAEIWQELLGYEKIGIYDDFFEFGGHSLLATQLASRLQETFQVEISLRELFQAKTIANLSETIANLKKDTIANEHPAIVTVNRDAYRIKI